MSLFQIFPKNSFERSEQRQNLEFLALKHPQVKRETSFSKHFRSNSLERNQNIILYSLDLPDFRTAEHCVGGVKIWLPETHRYRWTF